MSKDLIDRIKEVIDWSNLSQRQFGTKIGFSFSTINNYLLRKRVTIDTDLLIKILSTFDDINAEWLLMGTGEMFKDPELNEELRQNTKYSSGAGTDEELRETRKQVTMLIKQQESLLEVIKTQSELLKTKISSNNLGAHLDGGAEDVDASGFLVGNSENKVIKMY